MRGHKKKHEIKSEKERERKGRGRKGLGGSAARHMVKKGLESQPLGLSPSTPTPLGDWTGPGFRAESRVCTQSPQISLIMGLSHRRTGTHIGAELKKIRRLYMCFILCQGLFYIHML